MFNGGGETEGIEMSDWGSNLTKDADGDRVICGGDVWTSAIFNEPWFTKVSFSVEFFSVNATICSCSDEVLDFKELLQEDDKDGKRESDEGRDDKHEIILLEMLVVVNALRETDSDNTALLGEVVTMMLFPNVISELVVVVEVEFVFKKDKHVVILLFRWVPLLEWSIWVRE